MANGSTVYLEEAFEAVDVDIEIDIDIDDDGDLTSWEVINASDDDEGDNCSYDDDALDDEDKDGDCKKLDSIGSPSSDLSIMQSPPDQVDHPRQCKNYDLGDDIRKYESNGAEYDDADRDCKKIESIGSPSSDLSMQSPPDQLGHLRQCNNRDVVDDKWKYESNGAEYDVAAAGRDGKEVDSVGSPSSDVSMQSLLDQLIHYPPSDLAMEFLLDQIPKLRPLNDDDVYDTRKCESSGVEYDDADRDCNSIGSASSGLPVQAFLEQLLCLRQCNNGNVVDDIWKYESNGAEYDDPHQDCKEVDSIGSPWSDLPLQSPVDQVLRLRQCNNDDVVGDIGKHESNGEEYDDDDDYIDEEYDLDDELVPKWVNDRFGRQRMRKFGKKAYPKMKKSKRLPYHYNRPGCVHGKHGLGLKHCLI